VEAIKQNDQRCENARCRKDLRTVNPTWAVGGKIFCSRGCRATVTGEFVARPGQEEDAA
jgi:hypothetical protein